MLQYAMRLVDWIHLEMKSVTRSLSRSLAIDGFYVSSADVVMASTSASTEPARTVRSAGRRRPKATTKPDYSFEAANTIKLMSEELPLLER